MKTPDWKALHDQLDQLQRDYEALPGISDPDRYVAAREAIWQREFALLRELIADQLAERLGVARIARFSFELTPSWLPEAGAAGHKPVAPLSAMDPDEAAAQRRMLVQFHNDFADLLPAGLAVNMAATLTLLNLGVVLPLAEALKVQGMPSNAGRRAIAFLFFALGLYYRVGYYKKTVESMLNESSTVFGEMSRNAFDKEIRKLALRRAVEEARREGQVDAAAGKPMRPQWAGDYDLSQLAEIMREGVASDGNVIPFGGKKR